MHLRQKSMLAGVLATVLTVLLLTARVAQAASLTCGAWSIVGSPSPGDYDYLNGVATISASDVWTVGQSNGINSNGIYQTLVEHWDGTSWSIVTSPNPGTSSNNLNAVAAVSTSNVWAVGSYDSSTLIEQWDGSSWSVVPSPNPAGAASSSLTGVAVISASNVWAVGSYNNGTTNQTLVEHWNGTSWSIVASPNAGTSDNLSGVAAISVSNVWAVGSYNNGSYKQTLVEHWNGTNWRVISSPNPGPQDNVLLGVAKVSGKNVWAVGTYYNPSSGLATQTLIEHWNGTSWKVVKSPNVVRTSVDVLLAVTAISASNIWAVGYHNHSVKTLIEHWNGTAWSIVKSPNYGTNPTVLAGVAASSANAVWAVGEVSYSSGPPSQTLTEFYC